MNEFELKYGCNPNQKPSRIFMRDNGELPITVLIKEEKAPQKAAVWAAFFLFRLLSREETCRIM